jgi:hypothetical protein
MKLFKNIVAVESTFNPDEVGKNEAAPCGDQSSLGPCTNRIQFMH